MKIAIVGCGNMGAAFARALVRKGVTVREDVALIDANPDRVATLEAEGVGVASSLGALSTIPLDIILLAVKPQSFTDLGESLKGKLKPGILAVSIMAGMTVARIQEGIGVDRVIRAMPNTPCQLGLGATGFTSGVTLNEDEERMLLELFESTGEVVKVASEDQIDAVTAVSGSGPAYFYFIAQAMLRAGAELGLSDEDTKKLVYQTMTGAKALMDGHQGSLEELIAAVKSKGGTTEAALNHFAEKGLDTIIIDGMGAAKKRAGELSKM